MENYLNLKKLTAGEPYAKYRMAIWIYLFLLIFEGAIRKWVLPQLATPLLLVRDPIVIWLYCIAMQKGWLKNTYVKVMCFVSSISLILTLVAGHHNLFVAFFGWRIYFFHFPMIFIMAKLLSRNDLLKMGRFILYVSIPMTILIIMQFRSPQTAWVNMGVGGEGSAGFQGAMGYMRPPGTFSFTTGYVCYQAIVGCYLLYFLVENSSLPKEFKIPQLTLYIMLACYLIAIPTSISRTNFFQTIVFLFFLFIAALRKNSLKGKFFKFIIIGIIVIAVMLSLGIGGEAIAAFNERLETANEAEGGMEGVVGDRYAGGLFAAFTNFNIPFFGYGLGLGTNVGAKLMGGDMYAFGFNGEVEWTRIVGECGYIIGWTIIFVRLIFSIDVFKRCYRCLVNRKDLLPWMLCAGMLLTIPQGQWAIPTNLGFSILAGGLTLAAVKNKM